MATGFQKRFTNNQFQMKQVSSKFYDQKYFQSQSISPNFHKKIKINDFQPKYQQISSLLKVNPSDIICDYGCGTGDLSFLLSLKYNCQIIAIDYSPDAIKICRQKLKLFQKNTQPAAKIKFINKNNQNLPQLKNIKAVYFCDVFEHLYDSEIKLIISQIQKWHQHLSILIHTDNNNYLKFIQPIINRISLIMKTTTKKEIRNHFLFDKKRHINLTNPKKLRCKLESLGFLQKKLNYPKPSLSAVKSQLGKLSKSKIITKTSLKIIKKIPILSPSFFALYQSN